MTTLPPDNEPDQGYDETRDPLAQRGRSGYTRPPGPPGPGGNWRDEVIGASGVNILAGIWLIIAPWVLGYPPQDPRWNDVIFGIVVGVFAITRLAGGWYESWLSWINAAIGIWLFVAAFTIDSSTTASVNDIILGVIVFVLAIWSASATDALRSRRLRRRHRQEWPMTR